jgi:hypothetical protein
MKANWSLEIELKQKGIDSDGVDDLMDALEAGHPSIGEAPNGNLSVRIFTEGETLMEALASGVALVTEAAVQNGFCATILGVDMVTEDELDRRLAENN